MSTAISNTHYVAFLKYAETAEKAVSVEELMLWDTQENGDALKKQLEKKFGEAYIYQVGLKELFKRYLYNREFLALKPSSKNPEGLKRGLKRMGVIRKGVYVPTASSEQLEYLVTVQVEAFKAAAQKLTVYKMTPKELHKLLDEALTEV